MKEFYMNKFESENRLKELEPKNTLKRAGFKNNDCLCDIGAGTGVFTFPAANISGGIIYALDISDDMLSILAERAEKYKVHNVIIKKVKGAILPLEDNCCEFALMCAVLHHIEDKNAMMNEIARILKKDGKLILIDFLYKTTPKGPPLSVRMPEEVVNKLCTDSGFELCEKYDLGDNVFCRIFRITD